MEAEEHQTSLPTAKTVPILLDSTRLLLAAWYVHVPAVPLDPTPQTIIYFYFKAWKVFDEI